MTGQDERTACLCLHYLLNNFNVTMCLKKSNFEYLERATMSNIHNVVKSVKIEDECVYK